jgi:hypothetical protein
MKKNNLIPILLVAGAGVVAYIFLKNKKAAKEMADGVDVEPIETKESLADQSTTTSEENEPNESKVQTYIKNASSIIKAGKQIIRGRKKRKSSVIIQPTESSSTPFANLPKTTRKQKRTVRKTARTAKRTSRKNKKVLTGFEF